MAIGRPLCFFCTRLDRDQGDRCKAFPGGIPDGFLDGEREHRKPVTGDKGLIFEPNAMAVREGLVNA